MLFLGFVPRIPSVLLNCGVVHMLKNLKADFLYLTCAFFNLIVEEFTTPKFILLCDRQIIVWSNSL